MRFSLLRTLGYFAGGLWTAWGGRKRIEATQLRNLRRLVEKVRRDSPLFRRLYAELGPSSGIQVHELPVTRKPDLMRQFDDWLTIRSLPLERAREYLRDIDKLGVPIDDVAIFRTSGTSGNQRSSYRQHHFWSTTTGYRWRASIVPSGSRSGKSARPA